jgi:O-methyltransferase
MRRLLRSLRGQAASRSSALSDLPPENRELVARELAALDAADRRIVEQAIPKTMTGVPRLLALVDAVRHCVRREIRGAFAECGVWLGGSVVVMLLTLQELEVEDRDVFLYDTFEGMTAPTEHDVSRFDPPALDAWKEAEARRDRPYGELFDPSVFNEESVRETVLATGYPEERLHFIKGPVEQTIPANVPGELALLRLDTDWYESTRHELLHLYPLVSPGGVLIIDDYGHWEGCRRAVDEYFTEHEAPLLNRLDYTGRIGVKA